MMGFCNQLPFFFFFFFFPFPKRRKVPQVRASLALPALDVTGRPRRPIRLRRQPARDYTATFHRTVG